MAEQKIVVDLTGSYKEYAQAKMLQEIEAFISFCTMKYNTTNVRETDESISTFKSSIRQYLIANDFAEWRKLIS